MKHNLLTIGFLILISCFSHILWISNTSILSSGDWLYQGNEALKQFFNLPYLWQSNAMGIPNFTSSFYPMELFIGFLYFLKFNYGLIERVVFMWPIVFILPISIFILLRKIFKNNVAVFVGSLVFCFNTYFLVLQTGHLTLMMGFSLAPLVIYFFMKALESLKITDALITGLLLFIVSFFEFRVFYIVSLILGIYYLFSLFIDNQNKNFHFFSKTLLLFIPIILVIFLNLYWLLGIINIGALSTNPIFDRSLFGNEFLNIMHALTLHHPFWTGGKSSLFILEKIPSYFWITTIFALFGLMLNRKNKFVLFFSVITIVGLFLTKQVSHPFTGIYPFLFEYFPGFNAFREASKFFFLIVLGYSVLIGGFVNWLWEYRQKRKYFSIIKYFLTCLISLIFILNIIPLFTGSFKTLFVARNLPDDYKVLNKYIDDQDEFFRILWIPVKSRWATYSVLHPSINSIEAINSNWNPNVKLYRNEFITEGELVKHLINEQNSENLLSISSVKYVAIPLEDNSNDDNFFFNYGIPREKYINFLEKNSYLKKVNIGTKEIIIYQNPKFRPKFYATSNPLSLNLDSPYSNIDYQINNPSKYSINLKKIAEPFHLNFSESYSPKWKIYSENFKWYEVLLNKNNNLEFIQNNTNEAGINSYYINPLEFCGKVNCIKNSDGSYDLNLVLYFQPQSYMYLGFIISFTGLLLLMAALIFLLFKSIYEKKIKKDL